MSHRWGILWHSESLLDCLLVLADCRVARKFRVSANVICLDDEPSDYYLSDLLTILTSVKSARITDGGIYDGRMGK